MNNKRKNIIAIFAIIVTLIVGGSAIYVSYRLSTGQGIIPTAPTGSKACNAQCPSSENPSLLLSCTPSSDGTLQSLCTARGRTEPCGGQTWCCPSAGGSWTTNMSACPGATIPPTGSATISPTGTGAATECQACSASNSCSSGLTCDYADGRCKKADGSSTCWVGATACVTTASTLCIPSDTVTCTPDCSTSCGQLAKIITTCTNSCGSATTKQCPATNACSGDVSIVKKSYKNETANTPGNYRYLTEINKVARNEVFVYVIEVKNNSGVDANDIVISDVLTGTNQDQLTFVDSHNNCLYSSGNKTITCNNVDVESGKTGYVAFRVRVSNNAENGEQIRNNVTGTISGGTQTASNTLTVSTVVGCNETCSQDTECSTGLACDTGTDSCRRPACSDESDCTCPATTTITESPTTTATIAPTATATVTTTATATLTNTVTMSPTATTTQQTTSEIPTTSEGSQQEILPETGILDFPGLAAFGGGLLLAIIGILLAL